MMKDFLSSVKIKILQTAIIVLIFQKINSAADISTCVDENNFAQNSCFNNLIQLSECKAGQFAEDNYGNMFILYTCNLDGGRNRVLYGLNKDGTIYFPNSNGQPYDAGKEYQIAARDSSSDREYSKVIFLNSGNNNQYLVSTHCGYAIFYMVLEISLPLLFIFFYFINIVLLSFFYLLLTLYMSLLILEFNPSLRAFVSFP